ncbi:MAG TPA: hypothetical protein VFX30_00095 [bacterium]|nr:hypothetical protein [bacterium]
MPPVNPTAITETKGCRSFDETTIRGLSGELNAIRSEVEREMATRLERHEFDSIKPNFKGKAFDVFVKEAIDREAIDLFLERNPKLSAAQLLTVAQRAHIGLASRQIFSLGNFRYFVPRESTPSKPNMILFLPNTITESTEQPSSEPPKRL